MNVVFTGEIEITAEELKQAEDDTMQAVQNKIGHTGVNVGSIEFEDDGD